MDIYIYIQIRIEILSYIQLLRKDEITIYIRLVIKMYHNQSVFDQFVELALKGLTATFCSIAYSVIL